MPRLLRGLTNIVAMTRSLVSCLVCGEPGKPIAYGYPGPDMMQAADEGRIVLGGCVVSEDLPHWRCRNGHSWSDDQPQARATTYDD
jgi:hypothetical protein